MGKNRGFLYTVRRKLQVLAYDLTSPAFMSKVYFRIVLKSSLNLKTPKTFNEKLQWLKLNNWPNNPLVIKCGDKYAVREYVKKKGLDKYLNTLINVWENVDEINWDMLPQEFAIKCTHGCGYNIICENKDALDIVVAKKQLSKWMNEDFGKFNAEPHYSKMSPRIICEKYLGGDIIDYKFFCFNGEAKFMYIAKGFGNGNSERMAFFDENGEKAEYQRPGYAIYTDAKIPKGYAEMKVISEILAADFPFVRVDWYEAEGVIYFGELTFTPGGGLMEVSPRKYDKIWGNMLNI